jgi:hypothetical protein
MYSIIILCLIYKDCVIGIFFTWLVLLALIGLTTLKPKISNPACHKLWLGIENDTPDTEYYGSCFCLLATTNEKTGFIIVRWTALKS